MVIMNQGVAHKIPSTSGVGKGQRYGVGKYAELWVGISQTMCRLQAKKTHGGRFRNAQIRAKRAAHTTRL